MVGATSTVSDIPLDGSTGNLSVYRDTGCNLHAKCLTCPLPRCKYDQAGNPQWATRLRSKVNRAKWLRCFDGHMETGIAKPDAIKLTMMDCGVTDRSIHRALRDSRRE